MGAQVSRHNIFLIDRFVSHELCDLAAQITPRQILRTHDDFVLKERLYTREPRRSQHPLNIYSRHRVPKPLHFPTTRSDTIHISTSRASELLSTLRELIIIRSDRMMSLQNLLNPCDHENRIKPDASQLPPLSAFCAPRSRTHGTFEICNTSGTRRSNVNTISSISRDNSAASHALSESTECARTQGAL